MREAVILAAGRGSRLKPLTDYTPKALFWIPYGRNLIDIHIQQLQEAGVEAIYVVCGHLGDELSRYIQTHHPFCTVVRQSGQLGTAVDGLRAVSELITADFLVVHGDHFFSQNPFVDLTNHHTDHRITFLVEPPDKSESLGYGLRCLFDATTSGVLSPYSESVTPTTATEQEMVVVDGCMVLPQEIFSLISSSRRALGPSIEMRHVVSYIADQSALNMEAVVLEGWWANINEEETYGEVVRRLLEQQKRP